LVGRGGTVLATYPRFTTLEDPEGNELCVHQPMSNVRATAGATDADPGRARLLPVKTCLYANQLDAMGLSDDAQPDVRRVRHLADAEAFELDVGAARVIEQPNAVTEQNRRDAYEDLVDLACV
jgi:hypothetical protein